jgi:mono/diheme cytochrome c family protein
VLSALAQGIFTSRDPAAISRGLSLAAERLVTSAKISAGLLDGLASGARAERRVVTLPAAPSGWERLSADASLRNRLTAIGDRLAWPGHAGRASAEPAPLTTEQQGRVDLGRSLFTGTCANCHHESGRGIEGLAPPLLDSEWVLGPPARLTRVLLHGLSGPIKVRGRTHAGDMPAFGSLPDEQVSAVLTFIRRAWGHDGKPIDPSEVAAVRAATRDHAGAWSAEELRGVK